MAAMDEAKGLEFGGYTYDLTLLEHGTLVITVFLPGEKVSLKSRNVTVFVSPSLEVSRV